MHRTTILAFGLLGAMLLAGCAGSSETAPASQKPAAEASVSADTGSISGLVVDDEAAPVAGALAALLETQAQTRSDAGGRFTFNDLAPGRYRLVVEALGYESQGGRAVTVAIGEVTEVRFHLTPIPVAEPSLQALHHTFFINVCGVDVVGVCDNAVTCPECNWPVDIKNDPSHFMLEIFGRHGVSNPTGRDGLAHYAYKNEIGPRLWGCTELSVTTPPCGVLPIRLNFTREEFSDVRKLLIYQTCEAQWFCVQEKYDDWLTFFYNYDALGIPPDYTAAPKS